MLIRVVPIGNVPQDVLVEIFNNLKDTYKTTCRVLPKIEIPKESFNLWRKQYDADKIMSILSDNSEVRFIDKQIPSLLVIDEDLFYAGLRFVFSVQDPEKSACMLSVKRFRPGFYGDTPNQKLLVSRSGKEAVHEIGHYIGLGHCENIKCAMAFSPSVEDIDKKEKNLCDRCKMKLFKK